MPENNCSERPSGPSKARLTVTRNAPYQVMGIKWNLVASTCLRFAVGGGMVSGGFGF